jgi:Carboxypeptidase regulatory-like domain
MTQATHRSSVVVAQHAAPFAILVTWTTLLLGCTVRRTNDYVFTVTGIVTARDDVPLEAADVTLDVSGPVYEGIDLVKTRHVLTNNGGAFVFAYITHKRGVTYTITARKNGFEPQTVSGSAPPEGDHKIRLKRVAESDKGASARDPLKTRYSLPTTHQMLPRVAQ